MAGPLLPITDLGMFGKKLGSKNSRIISLFALPTAVSVFYYNFILKLLSKH